MNNHQDLIDFDQLLGRLKKNDRKAFVLLYRHARERLYICANAIMKDSEAAQDLVQDFFTDFWQREHFRSVESGLKTYLVRAIRNRAYNYLDKEGTLRKLQDQYAPSANDVITALDKMQNEALGRELEAAIARLPPMAAKVFRLHYIEKIAYTDIAELLHISKYTVGGHMERALKQLREDLKKETKN